MEEELRHYLLAGENVEWSGRPVKGVMLTALDFFLIPFSIVFAGFAILLMGDDIFSPFGLFFMFICLYYAAGRFFFDAWLRGRFRYAVTNQRILILKLGRSSKLTELPINRLPALILMLRRSGIGTIRFDRLGPFDYARQWTPAMTEAPQFLFIDGAQTVYNLIRRLGRQ